MKKSKIIHLVLISAAFASCTQQKPKNEKKVYMRSDTTAGYSHILGPALWYYAFRPFGIYNNGSYQRAGYYSSAISERANVGSNPFKGSVVRGGFGSSTFHVSS
ncbi:MAG: hypothetical protein HXX09_07545 [Bacteroidetes bacterium]|nr:hypothetical protein [Bacteroidota bacterium]